MKKILLSIQFCLFALSILAQQNKEVISLPTFNVFGSASYTISATVAGLNEYHYTLRNNGGKEESFTLYINEIESFQKAFTEAFLDSIILEKDLNKYDSSDCHSESIRLFYMFVAAHSEKFTAVKAPVAGELCFRNNGIPIQKVSYSVAYLKKEVKDSIRSFKDQKCQGPKPVKDSVKCWKCREVNCRNYLARKGRDMFRIDTSGMWLYKKHFISSYEDYLLSRRNEKKIFEINKLNVELDRNLTESGRYFDYILESYESLFHLDSLKNETEKAMKKEDSQRRRITKELADVTEFLVSGQVFKSMKEILDQTNGSKADYTMLDHLFSKEVSRLSEDTVSIYEAYRKASADRRNVKDDLLEADSANQEVRDSLEAELKDLDGKLASLTSRLQLKQDTIAQLQSIQHTIPEKMATVRECSERVDELNTELSGIVLEYQEYESDIDAFFIQYRHSNNKIDSLNALIEVSLKEIDKYTFTPREIEVEFNEGFIENIKVIGDAGISGEFKLSPEIMKRLNLDSIKFENAYPFGFSSKNDFDYILSRDLYFKSDAKDNFVLNMSDLIKGYYQEHEVNRRDYSPADGKVTFNGLQGYCQELRKDETYKLLEAKIFSDFVGLESDAPNGLIQTEFSREFRLYTKRWRFNGNNNEKDAWNYAILSYIQPELVISKIENKNRTFSLPTGSVNIDGKDTVANCATAIDLKEYESLSVNPGEINLAFIDIPGLKSTFYLNAGARFGRTSVSDSVYQSVDSLVTSKVVNTFGINTFGFYPKFVWEIKTDERLGLFFSYTLENYGELSSDIIQVSNYEDFSLDKKLTDYLHELEFTAFLKPGNAKNGRFFFRYRYTWMNGSHMNDGFHQAQLGYSVFIMNNIKE